MTATGVVADDIERLALVMRTDRWSGAGDTVVRVRAIPEGIVGEELVIDPTGTAQIVTVVSVQDRDITVDTALSADLEPDTAVMRKIFSEYITSGAQMSLSADASATDTTVTVKSKLTGITGRGGYAVIDPYTVECEIREVTAISGNEFTMAALDFAHNENDPVLWIERPEAHIRWFGAKCDGTTDDAAALQAAFDAIEALPNGGRVVLSGTPRIDTRITVDLGSAIKSIEICGDGTGTIVQNYSTDGAFKLGDIGGALGVCLYLHDFNVVNNVAVATDALIRIERINGNFKVERMRLDGNNTAKYGFYLLNAFNGSFDTAYIYRFDNAASAGDDYAGLYFVNQTGTSVGNMTFQNMLFHTCRQGLYVDQASPNIVNNVTCINVKYYNALDTGDTTNYTAYDASTKSYINNKIGFRFDVHTCPVFIGCHVEGVKIKAGIQLEAASEPALVAIGCFFSGANASSEGQAAIYFPDDTNHQYVTVSGCDFLFWDAGIKDERTVLGSSYWTVYGNQFSDVDLAVWNKKEDWRGPLNGIYGSDNFNGEAAVTETHNLGHTDYTVVITPLAVMAGVFRVTKGTNTINVHSTEGGDVGAFDYAIIPRREAGVYPLA